MADVELFKSGSPRHSRTSDCFTIRVGSETRTLTAGQWADLIAHPQRGPEIAQYPGGIDDMGLG